MSRGSLNRLGVYTFRSILKWSSKPKVAFTFDRPTGLCTCHVCLYDDFLCRQMALRITDAIDTFEFIRWKKKVGSYRGHCIGLSILELKKYCSFIIRRNENQQKKSGNQVNVVFGWYDISEINETGFILKWFTSIGNKLV